MWLSGSEIAQREINVKNFMPKKSPNIVVEEFPGDRYPSLADAQEASLTATAADLVITITKLLEMGELVRRNGKIVPGITRRPKKKIIRMIKIYALSDPRTENIVYVGQSLDHNKRFYQHKRSKNQVGIWFGELASLGLKPIIKILEVVPKEKADKTEMKWIKKMSKEYKLFNIKISKEEDLLVEEETQKYLL